MNILVTGSNGFIGGHVCQFLRKKEHYVVGLDRRCCSDAVSDIFICGDLASTECIDMLRNCGVHFDAVVHLASDMRKEPHAVDVVLSNCVGMQRLLEFCEESGIPALTQLSSLPVIGKPLQHPIREDHPLCPPTVYHATKASQELLADYAYRKHGTRTCSLRICAPVGKGMNPKTIFPVFLDRALKNEPLSIYGRGTRQQTFIHVRDIAKAIELTLISQAQGVYNLASKNLISNLELAQRIVKLTGSSSEIIFSDIPDSMDNDVWDISVERLKNDTGFEAEITIDEMIMDMLRCFQGEK